MSFGQKRVVPEILWETNCCGRFWLAKDRIHPFLAKTIGDAPDYGYLGHLSPEFGRATPVPGWSVCPFVGLLAATRMHVTTRLSWTQSSMVTNTFTSYDSPAGHWPTKQPNASTSHQSTTNPLGTSDNVPPHTHYDHFRNTQGVSMPEPVAAPDRARSGWRTHQS